MSPSKVRATYGIRGDKSIDPLFPLSSSKTTTYGQLNAGLPFTITVDLHNLDLVLAIAGFLEVNLAGAHICVVYREEVLIKKKEKFGICWVGCFFTSGAINLYLHR
jgi:hypothetical protein